MKNNQAASNVVVVFLILIVIGIIGAIGWFVYNRNTSKPKTIDAVLSNLSRDAKKTYSNATFEPKYDWRAEASATSFNKVAGYDYSISGVGKGIWLAYEYSDKSTTSTRLLFFKHTVPPAKSLAQVKGWVGSKLTKYGFTTADSKIYQKGEDKCTVLNDPGQLSGNDSGEASNLLEVNCFNKEDLANAATQMKPFVDEYLKANPSLKASDLAVGPLTIKSKSGGGVIGSSHAAGYDIAELIISTINKKQIALYYAEGAVIGTNKVSDWHYVTQADDEFGFKCGDMKASPDTRKALYDQVCLSEIGQVRLDTNNRALQ